MGTLEPFRQLLYPVSLNDDENLQLARLMILCFGRLSSEAELLSTFILGLRKATNLGDLLERLDSQKKALFRTDH